MLSGSNEIAEIILQTHRTSINVGVILLLIQIFVNFSERNGITVCLAHGLLIL